MRWIISQGLVFLFLAGFSARGEDNPLYQELTKGVPIGGGLTAKFPEPIMADGLDAAAQTKVLKGLLEPGEELERFTRNSVVARHRLKITDIKPSVAEAPAHRVDVWFIAYGDLEELGKQDPFRHLELKRKEVDAKDVSDSDLAKRKIPAIDPKRERIVFAKSKLWDRLDLEMTLVSRFSKNSGSILTATKIDKRFDGDKQFPNQWRPLRRNEAGDLVAGAPQPYDCHNAYLKVTALAEPAGALFVEYHRIAVEPYGWFEGGNVIRSKLPPLIQEQVRNFRRELAKITKEKAAAR
jgi:hypothetical protein